MTDLEIAQYYAGQLIIQYIGKPKAYDTVVAQVEPIVMNQIPVAVQNAFNINTAIGAQLDILGKYVGVTRKNRTFTQQISLSDEDFRILIRMKVIQNNSGSSLKDIQDLIKAFFGSTLQVFDSQSMSLSYFFNSAGSRDLAEVFIQNDYLPRPMGVQISSLIYIPSLVNSFAFRTYSLPATDRHGFNTYDDYDMDSHWLTYDDSINF